MKSFINGDVPPNNRESDLTDRFQTLKVIFRKNLERFDVCSLEGRILIQKIVYFAQIFGFDLGYRFRWYIHGPYSAKLATDAFELDDKWESVRAAKLEGQEIDVLDHLYVFLSSRTESIKQYSMWLEILGSIHFLKTLAPSRSKEETFASIIEHQNYFDLQMCEQAWAYLNSFGLVSS